MDKFELQKLRDLPIEGVAERLGLRVTRHKSLCPFHDDSHPSLYFKVSKNTYRCFVCGASGGTIDLVMHHLRKSFLEACRWLADESLTPYPSPKERGELQKEPKPFDAIKYERFFERPFLNGAARRFLFDERKIDPRVARWCRLTSWTDRQGTPWLQIPYYNQEGKLIGVQNRNLAPSNSPKGEEYKKPPSGDLGGPPRFRFPQGSMCGIYNLPILNRLQPHDDLYISEGCSDCWSLLSAGHKAIAIPSATLLSKKDKELLKGLNSSPLGEDGRGLLFHMYPDRDAPGERLFLQLREVLPTLIHHDLPPTCKDFSEYYLMTKSQNLKPPPAPSERGGD